MTRHNLDGHIRWLLMSKASTPANASVDASTIPKSVATKTHSAATSKKIEGSEVVSSNSPRKAGKISIVHVDQDLLIQPNDGDLEQEDPSCERVYSNASEKSMLPSASRNERPNPPTQHELATPVSGATSSLNQAYVTFLKANGQLRNSILACGILLIFYSYTVHKADYRRTVVNPLESAPHA